MTGISRRKYTDGCFFVLLLFFFSDGPQGNVKRMIGQRSMKEKMRGLDRYILILPRVQ